MMYPYIELPDKTLITHSHLMEKDGVNIVEVHFERPSDNVFDSARCRLPEYKWIMRDGYTDEEIMNFEKILVNAAHWFYKYAESGGSTVAKTI